MALYHLPRTSSGNRLREIMGLSDSDYLSFLDRRNLCVGRWSEQAAREAAWELQVTLSARVFVLLGSKVRRAFDGPPPFHTMDGPGHVLLGMPHPSGLCRAWNEPGAVARARRLLQQHAPWVPWGPVNA